LNNENNLREMEEELTLAANLFEVFVITAIRRWGIVWHRHRHGGETVDLDRRREVEEDRRWSET